MTDRPEGAPAQPQPQDQPSASPAWPPPGQPGAQAQPPGPAPTPTQVETPVQAQPPTQAAVPSAYPYPSPQSPAGYGPPVPAQASGYGPPAGGYPPGGYQPPGARPATGAGGRAVLWALVGAVVASAAWAGGVFLLGKDDTEADLRGYRAESDLCSSVDYSSFKNEYPEEDTEPVHNALEHEALDESYCSISLKESSTSSISDAYFSVQVDLHKKTDPGPEFTAVWSEYDQRYEDYDVEKVSGFGDEAYLVTEDTTSGDDNSGSRAATLAVRDGWMTYEMRWSAYGSTYDDGATMPEVSDVVEWLKSDTNATLDNLRESDGV
ncbi:conserved hypothetical protein [Streptomyces scabiei 87.22]|uniref:Uncharacterized protein n=1 Tax=Streptomyces scabiei (strain 87.22) TaxID=680198 RepID=C9YYQ0_STRSW|nr:hypothetical protein [Streptomyces scabiei]MDX2580116.1 hypothetical protein [Streptomyces scabiei]MDX2654946.1 hypothetical protein [Streptomyces scabiei]MDX2720690.1 hypothetical protein [Streptomyces scabiei]MDX2870679.1 hypothetical protein [Streptomyces scabiei]MDX2885917.1 hypothetical protein [Streptomyces scabiei]